MPARLEKIRCGTRATERLSEVIGEAQRVNSLAPVTVVTSGARAAVHLRRDLARQRAGLLNVDFRVLADVAERLGATSLWAAGRRPLTRSSLGAALRSELRERPGPFAAVRDHPSTEEELARCYEELRFAASPRLPDQLGGRAAAVCSIATAVRAQLALSTYDDVDLFEAAAANARSTNGPRFGSVIVHLPERLRGCEAALLAALAVSNELVVLVGHLDDPSDLLAAELADRLALALGLPGGNARGLADTAIAAGLESSVDFNGVVVAADPTGEVREAVRLVLEHLEAGAVPERLAIAYSRRIPYARQLADLLDDTGLSWSGPAVERLGDLPVGRFIQTLLAATSGPLTRGALLALFDAAVLRDGRGHPLPVEEWGRCSRLVGPTEGDIRTWISALRSLREHAERQLSGLDRSGGASEKESATPATQRSNRRGRRAERTAAACRGLAAFLETLELSRSALRLATSWNGLAATACEALERHLARNAPGNEERGLEEVLALLEELGTLDRLDPSPDLGRFATALERGLERAAPPIGRLGTGIVVGPLESLFGLDLDCAVVLGCVEGDLPARPEVANLFAPPERELLGLDPNGAGERLIRDRRRLLAGTGGASAVIATLAKTDGRTGRARVRSRFVAAPVGDSEAPTFVASLEAIADGKLAPLSVAELECAALLRVRAAGGALSDHHLAVSRPALAHGFATGRARRTGEFGRFNGRVASADLGASLTEDLLAPTTLETLASCPFRYFLGHLLTCEVIEDPERRLTVDPRDRGSIVHEVLERFVGELIVVRSSQTTGIDEEEGPLRATPGSAERMVELAEQVMARYERLGRTGKHVLWELERRRLLILLEAERRRDERRREDLGIAPIAVEHTFGFGGPEPVPVTIGARTLRFRGKIDRIDQQLDGSLSVIDYKSGRPDFYRVMEEDCLDHGRLLQLPVYALAAQAAFGKPDRPAPRAAYRFITDGEESVEFSLTQDGRERFPAVLEVLVDTIDTGCFPTRPGPWIFGGYSHCRMCDFSSGCGGDRELAWGHAKSSGEIGGYVMLVDPPSEETARSGATDAVGVR